MRKTTAKAARCSSTDWRTGVTTAPVLKAGLPGLESRAGLLSPSCYGSELSSNRSRHTPVLGFPPDTTGEVPWLEL